jgi:hypothetical protein
VQFARDVIYPPIRVRGPANRAELISRVLKKSDNTLKMLAEPFENSEPVLREAKE